MHSPASFGDDIAIGVKGEDDAREVRALVAGTLPPGLHLNKGKTQVRPSSGNPGSVAPFIDVARREITVEDPDRCVEAVATTIADEEALHTIRVERHVLAAPALYIPSLLAGGVDYPIALIACVVGTRGLSWPQSPDLVPFRPHFTLNRDILFLPDVVLEDAETDLSLACRRRFDSLSQAFGLPGSPLYGADGKRNDPGARR